MPKYHQGLFRPKHPEKYEGDHTKIVYRSSWELKFFLWCEANPNVLKWSSEEIVIPYICPTDNRLHRYFPDAKITVSDISGQLNTYLIEIKPLKQTVPPIAGKRQSKYFLKEVMVWGKNEAKWEAASQYCEQRGWRFKVITENDLFG